MNTYAKYCPNVFVAKCPEKHEKGDVIPLTTKYGKENLVIIFNEVLARDGFFYYSCVRQDGFDSRAWAARRAERLQNQAANAEKKSGEYFQKSNQHRDFLSLAEPIKVGHHSEGRHRKIIKQAWDNMGKSVEFDDKAEKLESRAEYWESRKNLVNLSMPESLEMWEHALESAIAAHEAYKSGKKAREHSYSMTYAKKSVNEARKNLEIAQKLWG